MLEVRRARLDVRLRRCVVGFRGFHSRVGGGDPGALRIDVGRRLHAFQAQQDVAFLDVIAFLHSNCRDLADPFAKNVRVSERFDFSRSRDDRIQVLAHRGRGLDGNDALIDLPDGKPGASGQNSGDTRTNPDFLPRVHGFAILVLCTE